MREPQPLVPTEGSVTRNSQHRAHGIGHSHPHHHHHHWAAKCKTNFSKEFEGKHIPLEKSEVETNQRELERLHNFFGCSAANTHTGMKTALTMAAVALTSIRAETSSATDDVAEPTCSPARSAVQWRMVSCLPQVEGVFGCAAPSHKSDLGELVPGETTLAVSGNAAVVVSPGTPKAQQEELEQERERRRERVHRPVSPWELRAAKNPVPMSRGDFPPICQRGQAPAHESHYAYFTRRTPSDRPQYRRAMQSRTETTRRVLNYPLVAKWAEPRSPVSASEGRTCTAPAPAQVR